MILETDIAGFALGAFILAAVIGGFVIAMRRLREERPVEHEGVVYAMRRNGRIEDPEGRIVEDPVLRETLIAKGAAFGWSWVFPTGRYVVEASPDGPVVAFRIHPQGGGGHEDEAVERLRDEARKHAAH